MREAQLSQFRAKETAAADKVQATNQKIIAGLMAERLALGLSERARIIAQAVSRLSAEAAAEQHRQAEDCGRPVA